MVGAGGDDAAVAVVLAVEDAQRIAFEAGFAVLAERVGMGGGNR